MSEPDTNTDNGQSTNGTERRQNAYHNLSELIDEADDLLHAGIHNERALREAGAEAEDLLFDLDRIEYELIYQIERAENRPEDAGNNQSTDPNEG